MKNLATSRKWPGIAVAFVAPYTASLANSSSFRRQQLKARMRRAIHLRELVLEG